MYKNSNLKSPELELMYFYVTVFEHGRKAGISREMTGQYGQTSESALSDDFPRPRFVSESWKPRPEKDINLNPGYPSQRSHEPVTRISPE
jgi:hypothetical protein